MFWFQQQWRPCSYWVIIDWCLASLYFVSVYFLHDIITLCLDRKEEECFGIYLSIDLNLPLNWSYFRKIQKSVADLEKLYKERSGVNFVFPTSRQGHEKVFILHSHSWYFMSMFSHFSFIKCQHRFWRASCLWINCLRRNSSAFLSIFLVDMSLTSWSLLILQVTNVWYLEKLFSFHFTYTWHWYVCMLWILNFIQVQMEILEVLILCTILILTVGWILTSRWVRFRCSAQIGVLVTLIG